MAAKADLERQVFMAAAEYGITSVVFRNAMGRKLGLNITDSECLSLLRIRGISTPTELAHHTGLTTGATTALLDRLEQAGYITRRPNPNDRRGVLIEIDPASAGPSQALVAGVQQAHRELIASYSEAELETILDFLTRFAQNVKEQTALIEQTG